MLDAAALADSGAENLTVVVADEQTGGQGRHGHSWLSPRGGLYCTFVLRLERPAPIVTLALGLAVREAVTIWTNADLRWPNDVMIRDKKLAGILTTLHNDVVLAGIGINLEDPGHPDAAWLDGVDRDALLERLRENVASFIQFDKDDILRLFTHVSSYVSGRRVHVDGYGFGITAGLDANGFLLLQKDDGRLATIYAGGVRPT